jgi:hypothetical protein
MQGYTFLGPPTQSELEKERELGKGKKYIYSTYNVAVAILALLVILAGVTVCIAVVFVSADITAVQRLCLYSEGQATGMLTLQSSDKTIEYTISYSNVTRIPVALYINGPIPFGQNDGPLDIALCGTPSSIACITAVPGMLYGKLNSYEGYSLKTFIDPIRAIPPFYYVLIIFGDGQIRLPLTGSCGFPN